MKILKLCSSILLVMIISGSIIAQNPANEEYYQKYKLFNKITPQLGRYNAVDKKSGVSCPDFKKIAAAFNMKYFLINNWKDFDLKIPKILKEKKAIICDVMMDPNQYFYPKISTEMSKEGKIVSPPLEDLSPLISRTDLKKNMLIPMHKKSKNLK